MQGYFILWMIHFSRKKYIHDSIPRVLHKTSERKWMCMIRSHHENMYITPSSSETAVLFSSKYFL